MRLFGNPLYAMLAITMSILSTASFVGTGLWIAVWVDAYGEDDAYSVAFYLGIYALWSFSDILFNGLTYIAYENGGWFAARTLHTTFMKAVMSVPLSWYKVTPVGRIVNRFSRDMDSIDTALTGSKLSPRRVHLPPWGSHAGGVSRSISSIPIPFLDLANANYRYCSVTIVS